MSNVLPFPTQPRKTLRPHQAHAIAALHLSLGRGLRRVVVQMPTGAGKTITAATMIEGALAKGKRVLFTAPYVSLIDQTVSAFRGQGIPHIGVMQASHPGYAPTAPVQVATVQTLGRREMPEADLVIVDECHQRSAVIDALMDARPDLHVIGLSATPWSAGMGLRWQELVIGSTISELIDAGYLCPFRAFVGSHPDLTGVRVRRGEFVERDLVERIDSKQITGDIVTTWLERGENRPTLCFAVNCAHARALHEAFTRAGVASAYVDARTDSVERRLIERRFRSGEVRVACSVRTLTTGVDWPVACIVDAAPTASKMLHVQKIGRGLRVNPPWPDCIILDHADNSLRHGLVTDIHVDRLCKRQPGDPVEAGEPPVAVPVECRECGALKPPKVRQCGVCGHEPGPRVQMPMQADGELVEITPKRTPEPTAADRQAFYSMALWLDRERGRGGKLARGLFKAKFGVWPSQFGLTETARPADQQFLNWEKSRRIAYAKGLAKRREREGARA